MTTTDKQTSLLHAFHEAVADFNDEVSGLSEWTRNIAHWADHDELEDEDYDDTTRKLEAARQSWEGLLVAWRDVWERRS